VLTRVDGDGRGGAALSMRAVTGKPIKLIGMGEKVDDLDDFHPVRIANRILGMGDIVSLVEKAAQTIDAEQAMQIAERMKKGKFDLADMAAQLEQVEKMGGLGSLMGMLPGMGKMKEQLAGKMDDRIIKRQRAIILSMTPKERRNPDLLKASRKKRIAAGSGSTVEEVNKLLKQHRGMADMMKQMGSAGGKGAIGKMASMFGLGGGGGMMGGMPSPEQMAALQKQMPNLPKLPEQPPAELFAKPAGKLPGLGGLPGLGAFNPFGKKK